MPRYPKASKPPGERPSPKGDATLGSNPEHQPTGVSNLNPTPARAPEAFGIAIPIRKHKRPMTGSASGRNNFYPVRRLSRHPNAACLRKETPTPARRPIHHDGRPSDAYFPATQLPATHPMASARPECWVPAARTKPAHRHAPYTSQKSPCNRNPHPVRANLRYQPPADPRGHSQTTPGTHTAVAPGTCYPG